MLFVGRDSLKSGYDNSPYPFYLHQSPLRERYDFSRPRSRQELGSSSYSAVGGKKDGSDSLDNLATLATQVLLGKNLKVVETRESRTPVAHVSRYPDDDYNIGTASSSYR